MKRLWMFCIVAAAIFFTTQSAFATKICLQDNFGEFFQIKGGRVDKKSWTVMVDVPGFCIVSGHADVSLDSGGNYLIGMFTSHDIGGACLSVRFFSEGDALFNSTGSFDQNGDGTVDGAITFTNVPCSTLPPLKPNGSNARPNPNSPFVKKQ